METILMETTAATPNGVMLNHVKTTVPLPTSYAAVMTTSPSGTAFNSISLLLLFVRDYLKIFLFFVHLNQTTTTLCWSETSGDCQVPL